MEPYVQELTVITYGTKHRAPGSVGADFDFPCLKVKNPHGVERLRNFTGLDSQVEAFVFHSSERFAWNILETAEEVILSSNKEKLKIAFHCIGGKHRSVAIAERFVRGLDAWPVMYKGTVTINHLELENS